MRTWCPSLVITAEKCSICGLATCYRATSSPKYTVSRKTGTGIDIFIHLLNNMFRKSSLLPDPPGYLFEGTFFFNADDHCLTDTGGERTPFDHRDLMLFKVAFNRLPAVSQLFGQHYKRADLQDDARGPGWLSEQSVPPLLKGGGRWTWPPQSLPPLGLRLSFSASFLLWESV